MPGASQSLGLVCIAANAGQGRWSRSFPTQTLHDSHLPLPTVKLPSSRREAAE